MRELIRRLGQVALLLGLGAAATFGLLIWRAMEASTGLGALMPGMLASGGVAAAGAFAIIVLPGGSSGDGESIGDNVGGSGGGEENSDSGGGDSGGGE